MTDGREDAPAVGPARQGTDDGGLVLLVDDDRLLLQAIAVGLESHGYHTLAAHDGRRALELLRDRHPCLVLLDLHMPDMDGWQFRAHQCRDPRRALVPVVVLSSRTDVDRQARMMGIAAVLEKPIDLDKLCTTVKAQCEGQRSGVVQHHVEEERAEISPMAMK